MNMHVSPSAEDYVGRPGFDDFLQRQLAVLPADAAVLIPLYEGYRAIDRALSAVFNMPRAKGARDLLEDESERASDYACAIAVKLGQLTSVPSYWTEMYLETMLSHSFYTGGNAKDAQSVITKAKALRVTETSSN
jgi:hypothetical protein